jgi:hypothetical protein
MQNRLDISLSPKHRGSRTYQLWAHEHRSSPTANRHIAFHVEDEDLTSYLSESHSAGQRKQNLCLLALHEPYGFTASQDHDEG